jgi:GNAT superfamily N-acetyltransferase
MIRRIDPSEAPIIQNLAHAIWPSTFDGILSEAQIKYMLEWMYNPETLSKQIESGHEFYLFELENTPVGFMGVEKIENRLKIHKLYVLPFLQGSGIGKAFIQKAVERAKILNCQHIFLNVNRFNKAVEFYKHIGMKIIKEEDIDIGSEYLMEDYVFEMSTPE